jgi:hypothetical protein
MLLRQDRVVKEGFGNFCTSDEDFTDVQVCKSFWSYA